MTGPAAASLGALRQRFIVRSVLAYVLLALAWIFFSDRILGVFGSLESVASVSTATGVFFVLAGALGFYAALRALSVGVLAPDLSLEPEAVSEVASEAGWAMEAPLLPRWAAYLLAPVLVALMLLVRLMLGDAVGERLMLLLFTLPVSVAALVGGMGPGLLATVAAALLTAVFVIPPVGSLWIADGSDQFQWALLIGNGLLVSGLSGALHRLRSRDRAHLRRSAAANEALRRSESRVQQLFDEAPQAMALVGNDGTIQALNLRFLQLIGFRPGELTSLAQWWHQAYPDPAYREEVRSTWFERVERARRTGTAVETGEYLVTCRDGQVRNIQIDGAVLNDAVLVSLMDMTERRAIEQQLRLWAESFDRAEFGLAIARTDDNRFVAVNPAFARDRGWLPEELVGQSISVVYPPESASEVSARLIALDEQGHGVFEAEHVARDGKRFPVLMDVTVMSNERGEPKVRLAYALDLSERRRAEQALAQAQAEALAQQNRARVAALNQMQDANQARSRAEAALRALRESEGRLALFVEHAPAALAMFDNEMLYVAVSRRWLEDYGLIGQDLIGRSHYDVFPELDDELREVHRRALAGEVASKEEDRFVRADGKVHWLRWEVHP